MNNVDVFLFEYFAEILVGSDIFAAGFLSIFEMIFINVTYCYQLSLRIDVFQMAHAHASHADDSLGDGFAGRRLAFANDVARDN